jgi:hypothetical protein
VSLKGAEGVGAVARMLQGAWRALGRAGAIALLGLIAAAILAGPALEARVKAYEWFSPSPRNPGDGGSTAFVGDLQRQYSRRLIIGGPGVAARLVGEGARVLYIVIGPDKGFTPREIEELARAFETGRLRILVADDTGVTEELLRHINAPLPGQPVLNPKYLASGDWQYILTISCKGVEGTASKALAVEARGGRVLCVYKETGQPAAVLREGPGWGGVLVVGDASIFSNFLYTGSIPWLGSSRGVALYLARVAGASRADWVVVDDAHYNVKVFTYRGHYGAYALSEASTALHDSLSGFARAKPLTAGILVAGLASVLAAVVTAPHWGAVARGRDTITEPEAALLEDALSRLDPETGRGVDLSSLNRREAAELIRAALRRYRRR